MPSPLGLLVIVAKVSLCDIILNPLLSVYPSPKTSLEDYSAKTDLDGNPILALGRFSKKEKSLFAITSLDLSTRGSD